jgi:hypothetical protein
MPHVTVYYKMFLPGGHHRQPRNTTIDMDLSPSSGGDHSDGTPFNPPFFAQLPYTLGGGSGMAALEFWSATDGTNGQVYPPSALTLTIDGSPLTITAWYFPISGPGVPPGGGTEIIDDAFSANLGKFIDDTFVDVTSDPSLTSDANVVGVVPTNANQTLVAHASVVSTTEPFYKWVLNGSFGPQGNTTLNVPKGTNGIAIAIYQQTSNGHVIPPYYARYNPWWWIETHGGLVPPGHGDPWISQIATAITLVGVANQASPQVRGRILEVALQQAKIAISALEKQIQGAKEG